MKRGLSLFALALVGLILQGALGMLVPAHGVPDFALLAAIGVALTVGGAQGLALAALVGYAADLLSRALFGEHAVLGVLAYAATRIVALQLDLGRAPTRIAFVALLSVACDLGHAGLERLFSGAVGLDGAFARAVAIHAVVNAVASLFVVGAVQGVAARLAGEEDASRRGLLVGPRTAVPRRAGLR